VTKAADTPTVAAVLQGDTSGITLDRPRVIVDVNLILRSGDEILLMLRIGGFADGEWGLPAGHLELGESVIAALVRETAEELGITIRAEDARFAQVMHNAFGIGRMAFFFEVDQWEGTPQVMEPDKCKELRWFNVHKLPDDMVPYLREAVEIHTRSERPALTLHGW